MLAGRAARGPPARRAPYAARMPADDALLEACRWAPDDDAPRLVWADAVGGERGELVVLQCDLARGGLSPADAAARRRRERELIARHGDAWAGLGDLDCRYELRRGFVEAIEVDARTFAAHGEAIFESAPLLRTLTATGLTVTPDEDPLERLRRLVDAPAFWRLHGLDLTGVAIRAQAYDYDPGFDGRGDEAARLLADSGALAQLEALGISSSGLTASGAHQLVASGELAQLEALWLPGHDLGVDAILAVLARVRRVASLDLSGWTDAVAIAPALPPVAALHLSGINDESLAALAASPAATTVERLRLTISALAHADGLRAFPRLAALDLRTTQLADPVEWARELAAGLPALRRLRLPPYAPVGALRAIAGGLGPQLEELDLRGGTYEPEVIEELRAYVAGEVLGDRQEAAEPLI
jgi:uncharacterized protein (TIGR02996 family)